MLREASSLISLSYYLITSPKIHKKYKETDYKDIEQFMEEACKKEFTLWTKEFAEPNNIYTIKALIKDLLLHNKFHTYTSRNRIISKKGKRWYSFRKNKNNVNFQIHHTRLYGRRGNIHTTKARSREPQRYQKYHQLYDLQEDLKISKFKDDILQYIKDIIKEIKELNKKNKAKEPKLPDKIIEIIDKVRNGIPNLSNNKSKAILTKVSQYI